MLYTLSNAQYAPQELTELITQLRPTDAILLWQDGVLQAVKNPQIFTNIPNVFALAQDVEARGITVELKTLSLEELVELTEIYYPQVVW